MFRPLALSRGLLVSILSLWSGATALYGQCGGNEPAFPVPECRSAATGDAVSCAQPNAARLWPSGFQPGLPGQQLPSRRDSTQWRSFTIPGVATGHELFHSLDIVGTHLYVVYNAGLQVWSIGGGDAEDPALLEAADGWRGDFFSFPEPGENDYFTDDIAALDPTGGNQDVLIAVAGRDTVGLSIWKHTLAPSDLDQLYQDLGSNTVQVRVAEHLGRSYAFAAGGTGVKVYDMTQAAGLASPCLDESGTVCPGVYRGELGDMASGGYLDVIERNGKLYVAVSDGNPLPARPLGLEIWEVDNPAVPSTAVRRFSGLATDTRGPALFEHGGTYYVAVIDRLASNRTIRIYDVDSCLDGNGCSSVGAPVWSRALPPRSVPAEFLTYSASFSTPFLYYGFQGINLEGTKLEQLLDLSTLGTTNAIVEVTDDGDTYTDSCTGNTVDYWGDYYAANGHGLRNLSPRVGKFRGDYFYRAAFGILDVHKKTVSTPALEIDGPTEGCPGEAASFQVTANNCTPDPPTASYDWTASGSPEITGNGTASVDITWTTPGNKTVMVTNADCAEAVGSATINIQDPSSLGFASDPTYEGAPGPRGEGENVDFMVETTGATQWEWDFGDGTPVQTFDSRAAGENPTHSFAALGTFTVTVTIRNCVGDEDSRTVSIEIIENPLGIVQFRARCAFGICDFCIGEAVIFDHEISGNPTTYLYDWDGSGTPPWDQSSTSPVTTHTYTAARLGFHPKLRVENGAQGAEFTHSTPLNVVNCAPSSITVSGPSSLQVNFPGTYAASAANCSPATNGWTWTASGGGAISGNTTRNTVSIVWSTPGTKTVRATNSACGSAQGSRTVVVTAPPSEEVNANFIFSPANPEVGQQVTFNGTSSTGDIASYDWTFGDGTTANGAIVTHAFSAAGTYQVTLEVIEQGCGNPACTDQVTRSVVVTGDTVPLNADFSFSPENPDAGQEVTFDGTLSTGDIGFYEWDFGDGGSATGAVVTHVFSAAGTYPVTLEVTEQGCGNPACIDEVTRDVVVAEGGPTDILILPLFAVDTDDTGNLTTFLGVRNGSETAVTVQQMYFAADQEETPFAMETYTLEPHRLRSVDLSTVFGLPADESGVARGWVLVTVTDPILPQPVLGGDYFRVEGSEDFASGSKLLTTASPDLCSSWQMRFFNGGNFDGGTQFIFYAPGNTSGVAPVVTGLVYDEEGNSVTEVQLRNSEVAFEVNSLDLDLGTEFGGIEWRFRAGIVGHVAGILRASGRYSVGLPAICQDAD